MISLPLTRYVLMAALRDRLILSLFLLIVLGAALSVFLGSAAIVEPAQFAVIFTAGGLRIAGVLGLVLFVVFYVRRSFDSRDVEFLLSRPISATGFILSHTLAFSILAICLGVAVSLAVLALSTVKIGTGHILWAFSLIVEYILIVHAALFFAMVVTSAAGSALSVFGLYVLARLIGELLGDASRSGGVPVAQALGPIMDVISMFVPRIDLFAQTTWLVYPDLPRGIGYVFVLLQGVFYAGLLTCAALIDLRRRQF